MRLYILRFILSLFCLSIFFILGNTITFADSPTQDLRTIESDDPQIQHSGNWSTVENEAASGGSYLTASDGVLSLAFTGTTFIVHYIESPTTGTMAIEIDGTVVRTIITTRDETVIGAIQTVDYLQNEFHIVRIYPVDGEIAVDAFTAALFAEPPVEAGMAPQDITPASIDITSTGTYAMNPVFEWAEVSGATYYQLKISVDGTLALETWYQVGPQVQCVATTCKLRSPIALTPGLITPEQVFNVTWNITPYDGVIGTPIFSPDAPFTVSGVQNVTEPSGTIISGDARPTFAWEKTLGVTPNTELYYHLYVTNGVKTFDEWFAESDVCDDNIVGLCDEAQISLANTLSNGTYTYYLRTWGLEGYGPWSGPYSFTMDIPTAPNALTVFAPAQDASVPDQEVTFTWQEDATATGYYLYLIGPAGATPQGLLTSFVGDQVGCVAGQCSWTVDLSHNGAWTWYLSAFNPKGDGSWGDPIVARNFTADLALDTPVLTPADLTSIDPVFAWNQDQDAAWYNFKLSYNNAIVFEQWYQVSALSAMKCASGACDVQLPTSVVLYNVAYQWSIQGWGSNVFSPVSTGTLDLTGITTTSQVTSGLEVWNKNDDVENPISNTGNPTFKWNRVDDATWYNVTVTNTSTSAQVLNLWQPTRVLCGSTECHMRTSTLNLLDGNYSWTVSAYGPSQQITTSAPVAFAIDTPNLDGINVTSLSLASPTDGSMAVLQWTEVVGATHYELYVLNAATSALIYNGWMESRFCNLPSGTNLCYFDLSGVVGPLANSTYTWYIHAYSPHGITSPWVTVNPLTQFTINVPAPDPAEPTLTEPADNAIVINDAITFEWNRADYATYYGVVFLDYYTDTFLGILWYSSEQAGCVHTGETCQITTSVGNGQFKWGIIPYNPNPATNINYQPGITPIRAIHNLGL